MIDFKISETKYQRGQGYPKATHSYMPEQQHNYIVRMRVMDGFQATGEFG